MFGSGISRPTSWPPPLVLPPPSPKKDDKFCRLHLGSSMSQLSPVPGESLALGHLASLLLHPIQLCLCSVRLWGGICSGSHVARLPPLSTVTSELKARSSAGVKGSSSVNLMQQEFESAKALLVQRAPLIRLPTAPSEGCPVTPTLSQRCSASPPNPSASGELHRGN